MVAMILSKSHLSVYEFDDNGTYIQTALLYDENGNDAKSITVLLTLTAGDELSSSR